MILTGFGGLDSRQRRSGSGGSHSADPRKTGQLCSQLKSV